MRTRSSASPSEDEGAGSGSVDAASGSGPALGSPPNARRASSADDRPRSSSNTSNTTIEANSKVNSSSHASSKSRQLPTHLPIPPNASQDVERRTSIERRPSATRSRASNSSSDNWKLTGSRHGQVEKTRFGESAVITVTAKEAAAAGKMSDTRQSARRHRLRNPWACSPLTLLTTLIAIVSLATILHSSMSRQLDAKGCRMSYMRPSFAKLSDFDTEHTRFASKYSTYLYREGMVDEDTKVCR